MLTDRDFCSSTINLAGSPGQLSRVPNFDDLSCKSSKSAHYTKLLVGSLKWSLGSGTVRPLTRVFSGKPTQQQTCSDRALYSVVTIIEGISDTLKSRLVIVCDDTV